MSKRTNKRIRTTTNKRGKGLKGAAIKTWAIMLFSILLLSVVGKPVSAALVLDNVQFDPAVIAAGDTVDITIQYHDEGIPTNDYMIGDTSYTFKVTLQPDDDMTKKYVTILDSEGDDYSGSILSGGSYIKTFRVKVNTDAKPADYQFKLVGQWYHEGKPVSDEEVSRFTMPVKKEGIILGVANVVTVPSEVRPGDNYVQIKTSVENAGHKDAKAVELKLSMPEGFRSSYADNNRVWIGNLPAGQSKEVVLTINVDKEVTAGTYDFKYSFNYMDMDDNKYSKEEVIPFLVRERPYLEISKYEGSGLAGRTGELKIWVKNTGEERAEAVDVRIIKESSQPFDFDVRSQYLGDLNPGEEGAVTFKIKTNPEADIREHSFKVVIRCKGDSDLDDNNVYTFTRRAKFEVTGKAKNWLLIIGSWALGILILFLILRAIFKKR